MKTLKEMDLSELLEVISVMDDWDNDAAPFLQGWYAVCNDDGIIAYFGDEKDAFRFRLDYINWILNS